jgi:tetratricopeptide (TPR) repeat protein
MANAYYARWDLRRHGVALRLHPDDSIRPLTRAVPNESAAVDSLRFNALMYDPFLDGALDIPPQIERLSEWQANRDARTAGLWAYARGDYRKAVDKWGEAIHKAPESAGFHLPRAYAWIHLREVDSAVADLTALIKHIEHLQDSTVGPYLSKDFLYYAIGMLRGGQKRYAEARAAYENTLLENLGFYMAHMRLASTELETATIIRADDPVLLTFFGSILDGAGQLDAAERHLRAAIDADTDYALPYGLMGHVAEQRHDSARAVAAYREYMTRASRTAPERGWVEGQLRRLTTGASPR